MKTSPLAPKEFPMLPPIAGAQLATYAAGLHYQGRPDLFCASLAEGTSVAGVFTRSKCPAAPVNWCAKILSNGDRTARAVVCNAGNANAFTGTTGSTSTKLMAQLVADSLGVEAKRVYVASTGVVGEPMADDALRTHLPHLVAELNATNAQSWEQAAKAIGTTDTFPKGAGQRIESTAAHIVGIAKGSGMIAPNMATMLAFVFTDLAVAPNILQGCLAKATEASLNRITVDSDTSTNDTVLLFATGEQIDDEIASTDDDRLPNFQAALNEVLIDLAKQIVRDGEGATKFVEVIVRGASSGEAAHKIARSIAESPLVKTAIAGEDANWGRIVMAVGKAGEQVSTGELQIWIGDELVAADGAVHPNYSEERATIHLRNDEVTLTVDVGMGAGTATVWTCDLGHGYIDINASYRS